MVEETKEKEVSFLIERCEVFAELCKNSYFLKYTEQGNSVQKSTYLNTLKTNYNYKCLYAVKLQQGLINLALFTTRGDYANPTDKFVFVFSDEGVPKRSTKLDAANWMTNKINNHANNIPQKLYLESIVQQMANINCANIFVTGHGFGGMVAEIVSYIHNLPGIAFCSPGLPPKLKTFAESKCFPLDSSKGDSFQCVLSLGDSVGIVNTKDHMKAPLGLQLFDNRENRSYIELHSIINIWRFFSRPVFNTYNNINICELEAKTALVSNGFGRPLSEQLVNQVYKSNDNLTMGGFKLTMHVVNLTQSENSVGRVSNLDDVLETINNQLKHEVRKNWEALGTLVKLHATIEEFKDQKINLKNPVAVANEGTNYLARIITDNTVDWTRDGIIYLVDEYSAEHGIHYTVIAQGYTVPVSTISVDSSWTHTLSHEAIEMLINPLCKRYMHNAKPFAVSRRKGIWNKQNWELEVCDPCSYKYEVSGIMLSDFVLPNYYNVNTGSNEILNYMGLLKIAEGLDNGVELTRSKFAKEFKPFGSLPFPLQEGGYLPLYNPDTNQQIEIEARPDKTVVVVDKRVLRS